MGLMQCPFCVVIFDTELRIVWANEAAGHIGGIPAKGWPGRRIAEVLPQIEAGSIERSLRRVLATGTPVDELEVSSRPCGPIRERIWSCIQFRIDGLDGKPSGAAHVMREVTGYAVNQRRLALADEASTRIGTTLDVTRTAEELLEVAVPRLADVGAVDLLAAVIQTDHLSRRPQDGKMRLRRVALRWPADGPAPPDFTRPTWGETDPAELRHRCLVTGSSVCLPAFGAMTPEQIRDTQADAGRSRMLAARAAGAHSMMIIPLRARGVIMGTVTLYRLGGSEPFTPADLSLATDLVSRAAVSIDNARLYTRERATALTLQRGLLPRQIPQVPGLQLAYRYVPVETGAEVGGDWFDVIPLPRDRCALIVGDVTGHDFEAASLMGQLRTATRTLAALDLTPADLLTRLDQIAADLTDTERSATCLYVAYDPRAGTCDIARAGHPLPAVARPGLRTTFPRTPPGLPLGTGLADGSYQATCVCLPPGSTLVLYTDGLVESPGADIHTGIARLASTLATLTTLPVAEACDTLLATLVPSPADDIAILMART
jgi:Stage II sporulation protein E (SpoIIE)/PAS fold/GAF domain